MMCAYTVRRRFGQVLSAPRRDGEWDGAATLAAPFLRLVSQQCADVALFGHLGFGFAAQYLDLCLLV